MNGREEGEMISSIEILDKSGISRATLNNYIKAGIIPKPVVRKASDPSIRARKVGFFPCNVLDTIETVRKMKSAGNKLDSIVRQIKAPPDTVQDDSFSGKPVRLESIPSVQEELFSGFIHREEIKHKKSAEKEHSSLLKVTIKDLQCPAYLINNKFEIDWINREAEEGILGQEIRSIRNAEGRNIFRLFFNTGQNNGELAHFHMRFFKTRHSRQIIKKLYEGIMDREIELLEGLYDRAEPFSTEQVQESYINTAGPRGVRTPHHLYTIIFREGILFIFGSVDSINQSITELLSSRSHIINEILKQRMPTLTSFTVLVADLQDSSRICAELPPEEYFELINQIWKCMDQIFRTYSGTYGKHTGDGMVYYFLKERDAKYIQNALFCALDLREKVRTLSMEWKMRKGWFHDLFMNMGINEGQEYFGTIPASPAIEFTALGDSVNYAGRLSDFARQGSIWTTKNLMNRLNAEERKSIRYGVRKNEMIMENMFSRVMDLFPAGDPKYGKFMDVATLPVTEIMDRTARENT